MWLDDENSNAKDAAETKRMMMQKESFPVNEAFQAYLAHYGRDQELPVLYSDLVNYSYADSVRDKKGKWTHWENAVYEPDQFETLSKALIKTYRILKGLAPVNDQEQFLIERIDFCDYGNSIPFRIKIIDHQKEQRDFFYVKQADASRIYGLELEHLLTQNPINFLHYQNTLVEQHIGGMPGDLFLQQGQQLTTDKKKLIAMAFVRFNESCFVRLLGDMRSYNFVAVNTMPGDTGNDSQPADGFHLRAIDFDQQCYEGKKLLYFPRFYKENAGYVDLVWQNLSQSEIEESQQTEFTAMAYLIITHRRRLMELLNSMVNDDISENYKINMLKKELNDHFKTDRFTSCKTMGAIVKQQLKQVLQKHVQLANFR